MPFLASNPASSLAVSSSITTNEFRSRVFHFIFQCNEMHGFQPCGALVVCGRRLRILCALIAFSCRLNYPAKLHAATACRFCVRPAHRCKNFAGGFVGCVRGFLLPAISASSLAVSSSMVYFVIEDCRRRYCLFWIFQLEDIVDFLLIHRPYGFIVQFLMINTGNGGSFVQL